jgi:hypothetical protein
MDEYGIKSNVERIKEFAKENKISFAESLEFFKYIAYERRTNTMIENGDKEDENICGIGQALDRISNSLNSISESIETLGD